ncbi:trace amine-associated receptor 1-like [Rhopilema esculentum]|uniref:trace amine-associated receptor 1-like n=1 Tax=Rhopilema esculentum TaxID=499914 RepID=UPI0031D1BA4E|eukprot:gene6723-12285_t
MQGNMTYLDATVAAHIKAFLALDSLVALLTIVGNCIFMATLMKKSRLHTPSNMLLGALCVSDIFIGIAVQPLWIIEFSSFLNDKPFEKLSLIKRTLTLVCVGLSFQFLGLVSVDRYTAICHPFMYFAKATCRTHIHISIIIVFLNAVFYGLFFIIPAYERKRITFLITCMLSILIIFCNIMILKTLLKTRRQLVKVGDFLRTQSTEAIANVSMSRRKQSSRQTKERNKTHVIMIIMLLFFICYSPWLIQNALALWKLDAFKTSTDFVFSEIWTDFLLLVNSFVNPLIYYSRIKEIRMAAKEVLCRRKEFNVHLSSSYSQS